jgi:hypothetical protein
MNVLGVLILVTFVIAFIICMWEILKHFFIDLYSHKPTIEDVKENIIDCLDEAYYDLGYEIMFRTPECVAYKKYKLHVAKTENGKEVIMIDLI